MACVSKTIKALGSLGMDSYEVIFTDSTGLDRQMEFLGDPLQTINKRVHLVKQ